MKKRPLGVIGLTLTLATWVAFLFSSRQALLLSVLAAASGLAFGIVCLRRPNLHRWSLLCIVCLSAAIAFALHAWQEQTRMEPFYAAQGQTVQAEGMIDEAKMTSRTVRYTMTVRFPERPDLPKTKITVCASGEMEYLPGEAIRFAVTIQPKAQPALGLRLAPDCFLEGTLEGAPELVEGGYFFRRKLLALRNRLSDNVYDHLQEENAAVVAAMVLGQNDNVSAEQYLAVNRAGTIHLLCVSGLHLSVITALVLGFLRRLHIGRRLRSLLAIAAAGAFMVVVGFSAPIVRAFTMTSLALAAGMLRRQYNSLHALSAAVAVICLLFPSWVLERGFWLSAGSTLGILLFARPFGNWLYQWFARGGRLYNRLVRFLMNAGAITAAAYTVTLPLLAVCYGWVALLAPLANILVAPFVPLTLAGGLICACTGSTVLPVRVIAWLTDGSTAVILRVSQLIGRVSFATMPLDEVWKLLWVFLAVAVFAVLWRMGASRRLTAYGLTLLVLAFSLGSLTQHMETHGQTELVALEGCDTAVLLCGEEAVVLGMPRAYDTGQLLRYLGYRGVQTIRAVIAADCGEQVGSGLPQLAERYPIDCVIGPDDGYILRNLAKALPDVPVYSGGDVQAQVLNGIAVETPGAGDICIRSPRMEVYKTTEEYDPIQAVAQGGITLYAEGVMDWNGATGLVPTPMGSLLYGETRVWLNET